MNIFSKVAGLFKSGKGEVRPENATYSDAVMDAFGVTASASGMSVNATSAQRVSAVAACRQKVAGSISTLRLDVLQIKDDTEVKLPRDALWYLLNEQPHEQFTATSHWDNKVSEQLLRGDGFTWIRRRMNGSVAELMPLPWGAVQPWRMPNGSIRYYITLSDFERALKQRELQMAALAGMGLSIDPYQGDAAKEAFRKTVEEAMASGQVEMAAQLLAMSGSFASTADYGQGVLSDMEAASKDAADAAKDAADEAQAAAKDAADAVAAIVKNLRDSLIGLESQFSAGGFARQYRAEDAASQLQKLLSGVGIEKDVAGLAGAMMSATATEVEGYFREIWSVLPTDAARLELAGLANTMLDLAAATDAARESAAQATAQAVSGAWANLGTASGWAAQHLGDSSGLQAQMGMVQASYQGATTVEGREAALGQIIALEQSIWQVEEQNRQAAAQAAQKQAQALQGQLSAVNAILGATQRLREYAEGLFAGAASGLSDAERLDVLAAQYSTQLTLANGRDVDAMGKLPGVAGEYLALAQQLSGTQSDYSVLSGRIAAELAATAVVQGASAKTQADTLQAQIDAANSAAQYASQQFQLSAATKDLIATQLKDSAKQFDAEMSAMQAQLQTGMEANLLLDGLPAELSGILNSTLVPAIGSIANAAMAASSMSAASAEAARQAAAAASAAASAAAAAAIAAASKEAMSAIPGFASGGSHLGGLRIVGERGPEVEATGPSRIWNQSQIASALGGNSNAALVEAVDRLTAQNARLEARLANIERSTEQFADQFDNITAGGNGMAVEVMT